MAIDTPQKRSSTFQIPGIMMNPFPRGVVDAPNRQQMADVYAGIAAAAPLPARCTNWVPSSRNTSIWVPEKEVVPC